MDKADILIVGAGPAGLCAALELARRRLNVRIVDKGEDFTPIRQSRALGVNNRTLQLLAPSGVANALLETGNKVWNFAVYDERGRKTIAFDMEGIGAFYPYMLVAPQGRTERLLAEALQRYGVKVEWRTEVISANGDAKSPRLNINRPDGVSAIEAGLVIGADGAGSTIRREFGFSFEGEGYPAEFGLVDLELYGAVDADEISLRYGPSGALGVIPLGGNVVRFVSPRPDISKVLPKEIRIKNVVWRATFRINFRHVETMQNQAVFLAGDAAHVHSPAGARGMNLGVEDACWLAWLIKKENAQKYSSLRLPTVRKVIAQSKTQTAALFPMNALERYARDHLANPLLKFNPVKRAALSRITGLDTPGPPWLKRT